MSSLWWFCNCCCLSFCSLAADITSTAGDQDQHETPSTIHELLEVQRPDWPPTILPRDRSVASVNLFTEFSLDFTCQDTLGCSISSHFCWWKRQKPWQLIHVNKVLHLDSLVILRSCLQSVGNLLLCFAIKDRVQLFILIWMTCSTGKHHGPLLRLLMCLHQDTVFGLGCWIETDTSMISVCVQGCQWSQCFMYCCCRCRALFSPDFFQFFWPGEFHDELDRGSVDSEDVQPLLRKVFGTSLFLPRGHRIS